MANRSNRRRVSLSRAMAFEAAFPISPRRADAHHGQEAPPSANRPDIRAQSHLGARTPVRSCKPRDQALISLPDPKPGRHRSIRCETERAELSTAARPPACQSGAQPAARPWTTPRTSSEPETPTAFPCLLGGVHIRPTRGVFRFGFDAGNPGLARQGRGSAMVTSIERFKDRPWHRLTPGLRLGAWRRSPPRA